MNRKPWLFAAILIVIALAALAAALLLRSLAPSPLRSPSPPPSPTPSPTPPLPTPDWSHLPTVTPPGPGEPTLPPEALRMRAAPTATPGSPPTLTPLPTHTPTSTPRPTPTPVPPTGHDDVPMVEIPAGEFLMGITIPEVGRRYRIWYRHTTGREIGGIVSEIAVPQLTVSLPAFSIDRVQVTNARYRRCVQAGFCRLPQLAGSGLPQDYSENPAYDEYPAKVSWVDANAYCQWVGKRLPTEAEWEKAARGTDGRTFPWGEEWDEKRVAMRPEPVGTHPDGASPYGVLDMIGNFEEWTLDRFALYPENPLPFLPWVLGNVESRVVRGGFTYPYGGGMGSTTTDRDAEDPVLDLAGFRCVQGPPPAELREVIMDYQPVVRPIPTPERVDLSGMVYIPAGEFLMGAPAEWVEEDPPRHWFETPQHVVYLDAFYIDRYEVTNEEYVAFLNMLGQNSAACYGFTCAAVRREEDAWREDILLVEFGSDLPYKYRVVPGYERYPVFGVSWYGARAYCAWLGKRLPTEAEWEKAARGTDGRRYPWGNEWNPETLAGAPMWEFREIGIDPLNVSPYGVVDMLGNAGEWVLDWFDPHYYALSPLRNPTGPKESPDIRKVVRSPGGDPARWGLTDRTDAPLNAITWWGFRCAYSLTPIETAP